MVAGNPGQIGFMAGDAALAKKSGYCYIYINNETNDQVYFDNFTLSHEMPLTNCYPVGSNVNGGIPCGHKKKAADRLRTNK